MFDWTIHAGDVVIFAGLLITWVTYRGEVKERADAQTRRHEENLIRLACIESDLKTLMQFYHTMIKDFFRRDP